MAVRLFHIFVGFLAESGAKVAGLQGSLSNDYPAIRKRRIFPLPPIILGKEHRLL